MAGVDVGVLHHVVGRHLELEQLTGEFAGRHGVASIGGEIQVIHSFAMHRHGIVQPHCMRVTKIEPLRTLRHDHGVPTIRREIEVVRIFDGNAFPFLACHGIDRRKAVAAIVSDPKRAQVVRRDNMLRERRRYEGSLDAIRRRVEHGHARRGPEGDIDERPITPRDGVDHPDAGPRVNVAGVEGPRHAGQQRRGGWRRGNGGRTW
jgi:hypothetical protein